MKTAAQAIKNWKAGMAGAAGAYTEGINSVQENPMAKAVAKQDKLVANFNEAVSSGRWANALNNTSMSFWKSQALAGAAKLTSGASKGAPKYEKAVNKLVPVWQQMRAAADSAGDDPIARVTAALQVAIAAKGMVKGN